MIRYVDLDCKGFIHTQVKQQTSGVEQEEWGRRLNGLWNSTKEHFLPENAPRTNEVLGGRLMVENRCETQYGTKHQCDPDQVIFKTLLSRSMTITAQLVPFLRDDIRWRLRESAMAAADRCYEGKAGIACESSWLTEIGTRKGGKADVLNALAVIQALLFDTSRKPVSLRTGGTSKVLRRVSLFEDRNMSEGKITKASRIAANAMTVCIVMFMFGGAYWLLRSSFNEH